MGAILKVSGLKKYYGRDESLVKALDDVSVSIESGQFIAVIGTSGSGKSTLLNILGGLDLPDAGCVQIENKNLENMTAEQLTIFRRKRIGFIFQNYNLIPYLTAYENIVLPVRLDNQMEDREFLKDIIHFLELDDKMHHYPSHLSGGQQQRVAIARALISKPAIILADEPTGNLDSKSGSEVMELLQNIWKKMGTKLVVITHDSRVAQMADRQFVIVDGVLSEVTAK